MYENPYNNDEDFLKQIFENTKIEKKPITGIVEGYHLLPYILVGPDTKREDWSIELRGEIKVSPKLIFSLRPEEKKYEDIFEEPEPFMAEKMVGRIFTFKTANRENLSVKSQHLTIQNNPIPPGQALSDVLEDLVQKEVINTGVIDCPEPSYYPISLEKFIYTILDREFG